MLPDNASHKLVALDIETDPASGRIFAAASVDQSSNVASFRGGDVAAGIHVVDALCAESDLLVGHNVIDFDIPKLLEARPNLALATKPAIDTLWLNPLAFPSNPYHRLVKHYKDGQLAGLSRNDPESDARLSLELLQDQIRALTDINARSPDLVLVFHYLVTRADGSKGFDWVFSTVRRCSGPSLSDAGPALSRLLSAGDCCTTAATKLVDGEGGAWPLAYALSWLTVAGGNSVLPPWVRSRFPEASKIVRELRATDCGDPACRWCREQNDPKWLLKRWFGFETFRAEPMGVDGRPLQAEIVSRVIAEKSTLGILPTGTGKSVCYQLPALTAYEKTGALTVAISPLVALMRDQVEGLRRQGITNCVAVNGTLSLPERHEALERTRLGEAAVLIIAPEQLRNRTVRSVLQQREIGLWVIDEAHCLSKWGHDFRPDYRYIGRFIREHAGDEPPPPLLCLTATAKPGVVADIVEYFKDRAGAELGIVDGGATRTNLSFQVIETTEAGKLQSVVQALDCCLPGEGRSGAIVYCATRSETERVADFLESHGQMADFFHAGLTPERKREVQERFRVGDLRVIAATNAFGMGIDKPDVRLVVHADTPGSLEAYLQEAGRAGRDRLPANCVLLFDRRSIERQFGLATRTRVVTSDISKVLKGLRRLDRRMKRNGEVVVTAGEIARQEDDPIATEDEEREAKTRTAIAWLEEAALLERDENRVSLYPTCLNVRRLEEATPILANAAHLPISFRRSLYRVVQALIRAPADRGISTDELCGIAGLEFGQFKKVMPALEQLGIADNDTTITALVHVGVPNDSNKRLGAASTLEKALIDLLREESPDSGPGDRAPLSLRLISQELTNRGHSGVRPDLVELVLRGIARDRRSEGKGTGSLSLRQSRSDRDRYSLQLHAPWDVIDKAAQARRLGSAVLLKHLVSRVEPGRRGVDLIAETALGSLDAAWSADLQLRTLDENAAVTPERALLWMHEQEVLTLGRGLMIFRPAMTIRLAPGDRRFTSADFRPLQLHYDEKVRQIHVMARYAEVALRSIDDAARLVRDYFHMEEASFLAAWLPDAGPLLDRPAMVETWRDIVQGLGNRVQQQIVADDREQASMLVLAGPGSGKTRVLVHRIAYLLRILRQDPRGILVLTYNRHAAAEIRARLAALIGEDAYGLAISTCHALAMRLVGASFAIRSERLAPDTFSDVLRRAIDLLQGRELTQEDAEARRDSLVRGYRWILVDEYQDIGPEEYNLISALAGRSLSDPEGRLSLFAVGDDDQNIYSFRGASVDFIRQFERDYATKPVYLLENYRSTGMIAAAADRIIAPAAERMKAGHVITPDRARRHDPPGGVLSRRDAVGRGRVQIISAGADPRTQAVRAVDELERLSRLDIHFDWARAAVIARNWSLLDPVRSVCEARGIPAQFANRDSGSFWRLRETQMFVERVRAETRPTIDLAALRAWTAMQAQNEWWEAISEGLESYVREVGSEQGIAGDLIDVIADWGRSIRRRQSGLLLVTAHGSKGLEFDDVVILDGGWGDRSVNEDQDASRRLFYVAMTRARRSLVLIRFEGRHAFLDAVAGDDAFLVRQPSKGPIDLNEADETYRHLDLSEVYLDFAGRLPPGAQALRAIERLRTDDPVGLRQDGEVFWIIDQAGTPVGRLARKWRPPDGMRFRRGRVAGIITRRVTDVGEEFRSRIRREIWEIVVPELVFGLT